ncbi:MAG: hypothetical protein L0099_13330 [Acidobacteria bacterium]|nr:hypothetical protein [Acidobacteriota bacterium]
MKRMQHLACGVVLLAVAACKGAPARLVAGIADTVVVNSLWPVQVPMQVLDAAGHVLPDSGVRYRWTSGVPLSVSSRGVATCIQAGDAAVRASLGTLATLILVRCRPVHEVRGGGRLTLVVGDPPQDLLFEAVDATGRPVRQLAARVSVSDSTVQSLEGWRIRARAPGWSGVDIRIGDTSAYYAVHVYERSRTLEGIRPGQHWVVPVRLAGGEMRSWQIPASPPNYFLAMLPDRDAQQTPRLAIEGANCLREAFPDGYFCFALEGASVIVYHPRQTDPAQLWSGELAVWREACPRSERWRPRTGACPSGTRTP